MAAPEHVSDRPTPKPRARPSLPSRRSRGFRPSWPKFLAAALLPTIGPVGFLIMGEDDILAVVKG